MIQKARRKRTLRLVNWAFIVLIGIAALASGINFVWLTEIVRQSIRTAGLGRALVEGYRRLDSAAKGVEALDPTALAERYATLAAMSDELAQRVAGATSHSILAMGSVAVASFGIILAGIAIMLLVTRRISRPLALLLEASDRLAAGDLGCRVPHDAADEMGALAESFNRMGHCLQRSLDELVRQKQEIEARSAQALAELRALSLTDELTGLPNLRALRAAFEEAAAEAQAAETPLAVGVAAIEGFRAINEQFGHEAGDLVVVAFARSLRAAADDARLVARYGGLLFVILSRGAAPLRGLVRRVEADLASVEGLVRRRTGQEMHLRVRFGTAQFPHEGRSLGALVAAADRAAGCNDPLAACEALLQPVAPARESVERKSGERESVGA